MVKTYVFDTFALLAFIRRETTAIQVREILLDGIFDRAVIAMCVVNLGESYYMLHKKDSSQKAEIAWRNIHRLKVNIYPADYTLTLAAARLKAEYSTAKMSLSYADCFAAALAQHLGATLVTGDPEFKALGQLVAIEWL